MSHENVSLKEQYLESIAEELRLQWREKSPGKAIFRSD